MIKTLFIANRGEIAVRIIRAARDLGISTVLGHSTADADSLAYRLADRTICIGGPQSSESYLNTTNIITAALLSRCDAIHPGVGFLSENADFARRTEDAGLIFVGPSSETIRLLGDKIASRNVALAAEVPVTPGSVTPLESLEEGIALANEIGYPVMIKASAGGGGRGIRIVRNDRDFERAVHISRKEALSFFGNDAIHVEKYLDHPRHVEVQLMGDGEGKAVHLGERDCSVQNNHQKLIEESPSTVVSDELRHVMGNDAIRLFSHLNYRGAGTVEFLVQDGKHYFMEVNARVQVEHPVTEMVHSIDIIREQLLIAAGKGLSISPREDISDIHAIEVRINARGAGTVTSFSPPTGPWVRTDTHIFSGYTVSPYYDALLAKIIVAAGDRQDAIDIMLRALKEFEISGVETNIAEQVAILTSQQFRSGRFNTQLYDQLFRQ